MEPFKDFIIKGHKLRRKNISLAIDNYSMAININPLSVEAYCYRGEAKIAQKEYTSAISDFTKAIKLNPEFKSAYYYRGISRMALCDYIVAISDFNMAGTYYGDGEILRHLGHAKFKIADIKGAIANYSDYIDRKLWSFNDSLNSTKQLINHLDNVNMIEFALDIDIFQSEITNFKSADNGYYFALIDGKKLIKAYDEIIDIEIKEKDFSGVIFNCSRMIDLIYAIQNIYSEKAYNLCRYESEIGNDLKNSLIIDSRIRKAFLRRGIAKYFLKDYSNAIDDFTKVLEDDSNNYTAFFNRGISKARLKDELGAISDFSRTIELNPKHLGAFRNRGIAKIRVKDKEAGIKDLKEAENLGDPKAKILISKFTITQGF